MKTIPPELLTQMLVALVGLAGLATIGMLLVAKLRGEAQQRTQGSDCD